MHDYCYDVNEYLRMRQFKSLELTYMGAANDKSILYKCAFSQERSMLAACTCIWRKYFMRLALLASCAIFSWLIQFYHIARVSPIKVHLFKINQNKRIRIVYHILWHIDNRHVKVFKGRKERLIWLLTTILSSVVVLMSNMSNLDQVRHFIWAQTYYKCYQQTTLEQAFS